MNYTTRGSGFERRQRARWDRRQSRLESAAKSTAISAGVLALTGLAGKTQASPITITSLRETFDAEFGQGNYSVHGVGTDSGNLSIFGKTPIEYNASVWFFNSLGMPAGYADSFTYGGGSFLDGFYINKQANGWGFDSGEKPVGAISIIDYDKDGVIGTYDPATSPKILAPDSGDITVFEQKNFIINSVPANFSALPSHGGTFDLGTWNITPEPATGAFILAGLGVALGKEIARAVYKKIKRAFNR